MKRKKEKKNFKIDLLNLEKLSEGSMKHVMGANETECDCIEKYETQYVTFVEYMQHITL